MKKIAWLGMIFILLLVVAACSSADTTSQAADKQPAVQQEVKSEAPTPAPKVEETPDAEMTYATYQVNLLDGGEKKLEVVKAIKNTLDYDLGKSKDIVDAAPAVIIEEIAAAEARALKTALEAVGATVELVGIEADAANEEPALVTFEVVLVSGGEKKLEVVKTIKNSMDYDLAKSKEIVDNAPATVAEKMSKEEAETLKAELEAVGATVEIK